MLQAERVAQRRLTDEYININPSWPLFERRIRVDDGAGGHTVTYQVIDAGPQKVRIMTMSGRKAIERPTEAGHLVFANVMLIGMPELDIRRYDRFELPDGHYEVLFIDPGRLYRTIAEVVFTGTGESS